jgi:DNA-binding transcriptional MocR family regulator
MRLGWIQTSPKLRKLLTGAGFINSGGSINHISSLIARKTIDNGSLEAHLATLRTVYRARVEAMDEALQQHFAGVATWQRPSGGYFFWIHFDESIDTKAYRQKAREAETGFQPGSLFSSKGELRNCLRLSFAHYNEQEIREGVARLAEVLL